MKYNYHEKTTDELMDLYATGALTENAYAQLEVELVKRGCCIPERPTENQFYLQDGPLARFFKEHYQGKRSLKTAFFFFGVIVNTVVVMLLTVISVISAAQVNSKSIIPAICLFFVLYIPYFYFMMVCVWRCSKNAKYEFLGFLARVSVLFFSAHLIYASLLKNM